MFQTWHTGCHMTHWMSRDSLNVTWLIEYATWPSPTWLQHDAVNMTQADLWYDLFIHVTWHMYICDMTHWICNMTHVNMWHTTLNMQQDAFRPVAWLIRTWRIYTYEVRATMYEIASHDLFMCVPWLIHTCGMTHSYVCHDAFIDMRCVQLLWHDSLTRVPWLIHMCAMTHSYIWGAHNYGDMTHSYVCHDSFICVPHVRGVNYVWWRVTWRIDTCAMTHLYVCHHICVWSYAWVSSYTCVSSFIFVIIHMSALR